MAATGNLRSLADTFLTTLGVPTSLTNEAVVMAWIQQEGDAGVPGYGNPLNVNRYGPYIGAVTRNGNGSPSYGSDAAGMVFAANVIKSNVATNYAGEGNIFHALEASSGSAAIQAISASGWSGESHYGMVNNDPTTSHLWKNYEANIFSGGQSGGGSDAQGIPGESSTLGTSIGNAAADTVGGFITGAFGNIVLTIIGVMLIFLGAKSLLRGTGVEDLAASVAGLVAYQQMQGETTKTATVNVGGKGAHVSYVKRSAPNQGQVKPFGRLTPVRDAIVETPPQAAPSASPETPRTPVSQPERLAPGPTPKLLGPGEPRRAKPGQAIELGGTTLADMQLGFIRMVNDMTRKRSRLDAIREARERQTSKENIPLIKATARKHPRLNKIAIARLATKIGV